MADSLPRLTAFLPWLSLVQTASTFGVTFVPLESADSVPALADIRQDLNRILSGYVDFKGKPVKNPTIVCLNREDGITWKLEDSDHERISLAVNFLMLAGFARNAYFSQMGSYVNSANFETYWQRFTEPAEWMALTTRRRDGSSQDMGYKHGEVRFTVPVQIRYPRNVEVHQPLMEALSIAREKNLDAVGRIEASLAAFKLANTDSETVTAKQEVVWLASAFEQLLDAASDYKDVGEKLADILGKHGSVTISRCLADGQKPEFSARKQLMDDADAVFVHRVWIEELYTLRGMVVHGSPLEKKKWVWSVPEHLLLGAYLFPLLSAELLGQSGVYSLDAHELGKLRAFDKLLSCSSEKWNYEPELHWSSEQNGWNDIISDSVWSAHCEEAWKESKHLLDGEPETKSDP